MGRARAGAARAPRSALGARRIRARSRRGARLLLRRDLLGLERDDGVRGALPRPLARRALAARAVHGGALGGGVRDRVDPPNAARLAAAPPPPARLGRPRALAELPLLRVPVGEPRLHAGADAPDRPAGGARRRVRHRGARRARERGARRGDRARASSAVRSRGPRSPPPPWCSWRWSSTASCGSVTCARGWPRRRSSRSGSCSRT